MKLSYSNAVGRCSRCLAQARRGRATGAGKRCYRANAGFPEELRGASCGAGELFEGGCDATLYVENGGSIAVSIPIPRVSTTVYMGKVVYITPGEDYIYPLLSLNTPQSRCRGGDFLSPELCTPSVKGVFLLCSSAFLSTAVTFWHTMKTVEVGA